MLISVLLGLQVLVSIALVALILIQHGRGADAGAAFGSGASATVFGARGSATFLTKTTTGLAISFFVISMALAYLAAQRPHEGSVVDRIDVPGLVPDAGPADVPAAGGEEERAQDEEGVPSDVPTAPGSR